MDETCTAIGTLANLQDASGLYLPAMGEPIFILELAERMIRVAPASAKGHAEINVKITGLRPGDKLHEDLPSHGETAGTETALGIRPIYREKIHAELQDAKFRTIEEITARRDLWALLDVLREVVPQYRPGPKLTKRCVVAAGAADD
jgi:O-antigen biosynthesis protein WbqV